MWGDTPPDLHGALGIAVGCGCVFVSSMDHHTISIYSAVTGRRCAPVEMGGHRPLALNSPDLLAFDPLSCMLFVSHKGIGRLDARADPVDGPTRTQAVFACRWEGRRVLRQIGDIDDLRVDFDSPHYHGPPEWRPLAVLVDPRGNAASAGPGSPDPAPSRLVVGVMDSPILEVLSINPVTGHLTYVGAVDLTGCLAAGTAGGLVPLTPLLPPLSSPVSGASRERVRQRRLARESVRGLAADPTGGTLIVVTVRGVLAIPADALPGAEGRSA